MPSLNRIRALVIKEFLAILRDPKSRFVIIGPPIIQMLVFGYAATFDLTRVPFAVYNEDSGQAARELIAHFEGSSNFRHVATVSRQEDATSLIDSKQALLVVHVGPRFSRDLMRGQSTSVQVIIDGRDSNTAMLVLNYARSIVTGYNEQWAREQGRSGPSSRIESRAWFNPNLESRWFIVPGIVGLLTLVVTTMVTALSVAREREQGTFDQLLVTPFQPAEILAGKALPGFIIGIVEATLIVTFAVFWFKVPLRGNLLTLYAGLALFILSTIGVGLMISSLAVTMQQGLLGAFLFLVPAIILSGFTTPIANMPGWVQTITLADPMRYLMVILRGVFLEGAGIGSLVSQLWPMAVIGVVNLTLAAWLFRRRIY